MLARLFKLKGYSDNTSARGMLWIAAAGGAGLAIGVILVILLAIVVIS